MLSEKPRVAASQESCIDAAMIRHAPFNDPLLGSIRSLLLRTGLPDWMPVLEEWLSRYAGLEKWLTNPADAPVPSVLNLLQRYVESGAPVTDAEFAADLTQLPFLYWHARWPAWEGATSSWNALVETLTQFEQRNSSGRWPAFWESDRPMLDPKLISGYLLEQLRVHRNTLSHDIGR